MDKQHRKKAKKFFCEINVLEKKVGHVSDNISIVVQAFGEFIYTELNHIIVLLPPYTPTYPHTERVGDFDPHAKINGVVFIIHKT